MEMKNDFVYFVLYSLRALMIQLYCSDQPQALCCCSLRRFLKTLCDCANARKTSAIPQHLTSFCCTTIIVIIRVFFHNIIVYIFLHVKKLCWLLFILFIIIIFLIKYLMIVDSLFVYNIIMLLLLATKKAAKTHNKQPIASQIL